MRTLRRSAAGEAGLAGPLPAGDGAVCQGLREVAAGRQRTGRGGLLRSGLAHGQIDRQDALARARGRTGLVDDPFIWRWTSFALHKGHRYATVVVDPIGRQVLWVWARTVTRDGARLSFEQLPEGVAERIEAVAIDMTTAYELEIKEQCPQAEIVFDLYHVVAKYGREVIDRVRWIRPTNCDMTS
ncbi:transposase, partial [Burkholderia pseudomallei]